jgi:hypothetical protein
LRKADKREGGKERGGEPGTTVVRSIRIHFNLAPVAEGKRDRSKGFRDLEFTSDWNCDVET